MIENIIIAILLAALIGILLVGLFGPVLSKTNVPIMGTLGEFFIHWGWALGVIIGVLWYFLGGPIFGFGGKR